MAKSRFTAEQIILKLREAEVEQAKGKTIEEMCRKLVSPRLAGASMSQRPGTPQPKPAI